MRSKGYQHLILSQQHCYNDSMVNAHDPLWTLDQLSERVAAALAVDYSGQSNGRVSDLPNQRTIRYYTTLGLIDRAIWRQGRTALYTLRHLLQLVAIKRLQAAGLSLAAIQARLIGLTDTALKKAAQLPADFDPGEPKSTDNAMSADTPEENLRAERFWSAAVPSPRPSPPSLVGVPLEAGVTLLLESVRPLDEHDRSALRLAAAPLLKFLHVRRLVGGEGATSTQGETP
jgi:DNA-binding transcriptional MerR regulator